MTIEELKAEADAIGYKLVKKSPPMPKLSKCKCGRRPHKWYTSKGMFFRCEHCDIEGNVGKNRRKAVEAWNKRMEKSDGSLYTEHGDS